MEFYDPLESCPYNITHRILRSRMQFHVAICAQNHKHLDMLQCPFDARHVIKRIEFEHHKNTCPARESVLNYADHDARLQAQLKVLPIDVKPVGKWHEKWDKDADVKTYNPLENIKNKPIVYPLIGVSKTKRKTHRLAERARYNRVKEYSEISSSRRNSYSGSMNTSSKLSLLEVVYEIGESTNEQSYKPLRPPTKYVAANSIDKSVDKVAKLITESPGYMARNSEKSSSMSEIDETSNDSFSSTSQSSSSQKHISSKVPSEDFEIVKKLPTEFHVTAASTKNKEKCVIPHKISIVSNEDKYKFDTYQYKGQQKCSVPDLLSMASSTNDCQFEAHQCDDQEQFSMADAVSTVSSKDLDQFEPLQPRDQEIYSIPDLVVSSDDKYHFESFQDSDEDGSSYSTYSVVSSKDKYAFKAYQYNEPEKFSIPDANSIVSSKDNYRFMPRQHKDYEKSSIADRVSVISSKDDYGFEPYQDNEQERWSIPNITSGRDHYQFVSHEYEDYEKSSITQYSDTISDISSKGENGFKPYHYNEQDKYSIPDITSRRDSYQFELHQYKDYDNSSISDTVSIASSRAKYQFGPHQYRDYDKSHAPDTLSVISTKNDCQFEAYQCNEQEEFSTPETVNTTLLQDRYLHKAPEKSLSLTVDEVSEINSEYSYIEDDTAVLSETIKKVAEKNGDKKNYLMTDIVYDALSDDDESQYNMTKVSWNPDVTPTSSENYETASEALSFKTAESTFSSDNSTTMKPLEDVGIFERLFQLFKDITMNDKGHKKKSDSLNHVDFSRGKLFRRCGANFLNLKESK